jgi:hypothetical protein
LFPGLLAPGLPFDGLLFPGLLAPGLPFDGLLFPGLLAPGLPLEPCLPDCGFVTEVDLIDVAVWAGMLVKLIEINSASPVMVFIEFECDCFISRFLPDEDIHLINLHGALSKWLKKSSFQKCSAHASAV